MIEKYNHSIGGGGFYCKCILELDLENLTFEINFSNKAWSTSDTVYVTGKIVHIDENYFLLNTIEFTINQHKFNKNGITFEFIKLNKLVEVSEWNNEWKDISMGNSVVFNQDYNFDSILVIQHEIFDFQMVSSSNAILDKLLGWFRNMKFKHEIVEISDNET